MKKIFTLFAVILCATSAWAWCGHSFITVNGKWYTGSNSYKHEGGYFNGANLGDLTTLVLGGELQVYPKSGEAATLCYKIDDGGEKSISLPKTGEDGNNSKHSGSGKVDLSALSGGEHTISVWFKHNSDYDSNNSKNFVAKFNIPATAPDRYITGTIAGGWDGNEVKMTYDEKTQTYSHTFAANKLSAGVEYKLKVTGGNWDYNCGTINGTIPGVLNDGEGNVCFTLKTVGDVTISFQDAKITVATTGEFKVPVTYEYYILGTMNSWSVKEDYGLADEDNDGIYTREITLTSGQHDFKINVGNWDSQWGWKDVEGNYSEATDAKDDNKIKITLTAEKTFTVLFNTSSKKITFEGLTQIHTVKVTAKNGTVTGAGDYADGATATLIATPAAGYEFVNWTVAGEEVSTEAAYSFIVTADVALVANFEKAATEVVLENAYKEVYTIMNRANFFGEHATYGDISVQVNNYNGYGTYAEGVSSRIDGVKVNGSATFENNGETDLLTATLTDAEGTVYIVKAEVAAPKTYNVVATEAQYTKAETWAVTYTVTGLSVDKENYTLTIYAMEEGNEASMGEEGAIQGLVELSEVEGVLTVTGTLKDAAENKYVLNFTATPKASETYTLTFEDMVIEPGQWDDNLHITAENAEYAIEFQLFGGKTKGYGEYGFTDGYPDVDEVYINFEYAQLKEGTVAKYYKNEETGLATIEATFLLGIDTYIVTLTGEPLVNPEDIVPTDTINITMTEGTIGLVSGMVKVAASSEEAELSILLVGEDPYKATTKDFSAYSSLVTTAGELTFLRGGLEIVEVGDVKIAYIGVLCSDHKWYNIVLTTGTEAPTALDNLNTTVAPVKMIENGQLIIINKGVQYNAQGAILK